MPAADDDRHIELAIAIDLLDRLIHRPNRLFEAPAAASCGAQRPQSHRAERRGGKSGAAGLGEREPGTVGVLDVVEPVPGHLVGGQQTSGKLGARHLRRPRGEQVELDLGRRARRPASPDDLENVGVEAGELERRGALTGDRGEALAWLVDGDEHADGPTPQPERVGVAVGQRSLEPVVELGQRVGGDLGPDGERALERVWEFLAARHAAQVRPVDVDDVQSDRHARDPLRLSDQLIPDQVRRHLVEDMGRVDDERSGVAELAGRTDLGQSGLLQVARPGRRGQHDSAVGLGGGEPNVAARLLCSLVLTSAPERDRREKLVARMEMTIKRRAGYAGPLSHPSEARARILIELDLGRSEQALAVPARIRACALRRRADGAFFSIAALVIHGDGTLCPISHS